jgi:lipopolysaccharide transport system ATP-binding protein
LKDVSFDVPKGQALGVIGHNGAGKTTLLKILSRITDPTQGEAIMHGRTGSLLEVGTGFHPELTGRENIFMNGAILGMRKKEIEGKLDQIIDFSGIEQFIDTPVKRYSTGMYVRLAFAVAAHLDTDILFVDEVLSVGDLAFQRRCLGKMQEQTSAEGRTVLFVSHNLPAVKMLTDQCIWIDHGSLKMQGQTDEVFRAYVASQRLGASDGFKDLSDLGEGRTRTDLAQHVTFDAIGFRDPDGSFAETHFEGDPIDIVLRLRVRRAVRATTLTAQCRVSTAEGLLLFTPTFGPLDGDLEPGVYETAFHLEANPLGAGTYNVELYMTTGSPTTGERAEDQIPLATSFFIETNPSHREGRYLKKSRRGMLYVPGPWTPLAPALETVEQPQA